MKRTHCCIQNEIKCRFVYDLKNENKGDVELTLSQHNNNSLKKTNTDIAIPTQLICSDQSNEHKDAHYIT